MWFFGCPVKIITINSGFDALYPHLFSKLLKGPIIKFQQLFYSSMRAEAQHPCLNYNFGYPPLFEFIRFKTF